MTLLPAPSGYSIVYLTEKHTVDNPDYFQVAPLALALIEDFTAGTNGGTSRVLVVPLVSEPKRGVIPATWDDNYVGLAPDDEIDGWFADYLVTHRPPEPLAPLHGVVK